MRSFWVQALLGAVCSCALISAGCSKKVAVAKPAAPVEQPKQASAPRPQQQVATAKQAAAPQARQTTTAKPAQMPKSERIRLEDSLARLEDALFDYDKATIRPDAMQALQTDVAVVREILTNYPQEKLRIEGHADQRGSDEYNLALGDRRAAVAKDFLVMNGVPSGQLDVISYGKQRPVCTDQNETCYQKNRRAHLTIASR